MTPRLVATGRAVLGAALLGRPGSAAALLGQERDSRRHPVLRVLGARHLVQAALLLGRPTRGVVTAAVAVDASHLASCLLLAAVSSTRRRPALREAAVEAAVLVGTAATRPRATRRPQADTEQARVRLTHGQTVLRPHLVLPVGGRTAAGSAAARGLEQVLALPAGVGLTIGQGRAAGLRLPDPTLSPTHARITLAGDGTARLDDLDSLNGTQVNGVPGRAFRLHDGDRIELGHSTLVFKSGQR
jgi:hypothetical protein